MEPSGFQQPGVESAFEPTQWTVVLRAARRSPDATEAFGRLAVAYWRPLFNYVRRRGYQPADAEDLTQSFFEYLLHQQPLESVDPAKGRFRAFLLALLRHFLANKWDHENAQKRGGGREFVSWDALDPDEEFLASSLTANAEGAFDRDWAQALVKRVLTELRTEYTVAGRGDMFNGLQSHLLPDARGVTYASTAADMGVSEEAARMAAMRLRRRFHRLLRAAISETVTNPEDVDEELRYLSQLWISPAN